MRTQIDVLLVDDCDADSRLTLAGLHRGAPSASSLRVKDGEQALRFLFDLGFLTREPQLPRLILLELNIPIVSGYSVLKRVRANVSTQCIPVIVLTSSRDPIAIHDSYALGAQTSLIKPSDADEHVAKVARCVGEWLHAPSG